MNRSAISGVQPVPCVELFMVGAVLGFDPYGLIAGSRARDPPLRPVTSFLSSN